ncbi:unnamed protein product [Ectocarpus sp. 13 AM-2016]
MGTFCESWDSNWMDGSCDGFQNNSDDSDGGADAFEAALQPLPAWDGLAFSTDKGNAESDIVWGTRQRARYKSAPSPSREHFPGVLDDLNLGPAEAGDCTGNVSSTLRTTKLAGDPDRMHLSIGRAWSVTRSTSPEPKPKGHDLETGDTLTHVIRLHRSGSVVVERKGKPNARGGIIGDAGVLRPRQHAGEKNFYPEEEQFWQERCPREADNAVVVQQTAPTASPRVTNGRAASYDYFTAGAAHRADRPAGKSVPPDGNGPLRGTVPGRPTGGRKTTRFEEEVNDCVQEKCATQGIHMPPPSPRRTARIGRSARAKAITERKRNKSQRRRFPSLRDAESVLRGVLESVEDARSTEEDSPSAMRTPQEARSSVLRQKVADLVRDETHEERGEYSTGKHGDSIGGTSPGKHRAQTSRQYDGDNGPSPLGICGMGNCSGFGERGAMARNESRQVDRHEQRQCFEHKRAGVAHSEEEEEEEEEGDDAQESAGRVAELSRRIAMRCLRIEQECLRREHYHTRLFQEQLRGVRLGAQQVARRTIHNERIRQKQLLLETQERFEEKERGLVAKLERAEESWKVERESLHANTAAAKSEMEKCRRQTRAAAEAGINATKEALEKQRLDLQRGWAEEKGGLRRAAEDALRRAMEGNARAREESAVKAQTAQDSLDAQVRSWKAKAETAERRAAEEREQRRSLEAGVKGALAQEVEKAQKAQEAVLRDLRTKTETDRAKHAEEIERLQEEHRAALLRVHQDKKSLFEVARRQWEEEMQELRQEAAAKAENAATRATAERSEALRRLRLAHDTEMRKAGRDILRLEREARRCQQQQGPSGMAPRSKQDNSTLSPMPRGSYSPRPLLTETAGARSCLDGVEAEMGSQTSPSSVLATPSINANPDKG